MESASASVTIRQDRGATVTSRHSGSGRFLMGLSIFPWDDVVIDTSLRPDEVVEVLSNYIEPLDMHSLFAVERPYYGKIQGHTFKLVRATRYSNSMKPVIRGRVVEAGH